MLKVEDKVKIINQKDSKYGKIGKIIKIKPIEERYTYPINVVFEDGMEIPYCESELELCENETQKTNKIAKRLSNGEESIIEWNICDKEITISVSSNPIALISLLKLILKETELYNYKYHRIAPYKLTRIYDTEKLKHVYTFSFVDVRSEDYEIISKEIIITDKNMGVEGKFKMFIPDFLEICAEKNLLKRDGDEYILNRNLSKAFNSCRYIKSKPSEDELWSKGFIIPEGYKKLLNQ